VVRIPSFEGLDPVQAPHLLWHWVGPNTANLRELSVLSNSYGFPVWALEMPACTYLCDLGDVSPDPEFFFDIPGDLG